MVCIQIFRRLRVVVLITSIALISLFYLAYKQENSTAGAAYIRDFIFYYHIKYHILNMLKIKRDINQQDLRRVDLHFVIT